MMKLIALLTLLYSVSVAAQFCTDTSPSWRDIANSACSWYEAESDLRCPFAEQLRPRNGFPADVVCCACGGGNFNDPNVGSFYIQSQVTGRFLGLNRNGRVAALSNKNRRSQISVESAPGTDEYYIKFFNGSYLSFFPSAQDVSTWQGTPAAYETFTLEQFISIPGQNIGPALKNKKFGNFLTVADNVGTSKQTGDGAHFNFISVNGEDAIFIEEGDEMEE